MAGDSVPPWLALGSFLGKGPRYLAAYAGWRARRALTRRLEGSPAWPRASALAPARAAELRARLRARASPRPLCDWSRRGDLVDSIPEAVRFETIAAADAAVERRFRYRGCEMSFRGGAVDWTSAPGGNTDWTWDLNRHHFFVVLGRAYWYTENERYAGAFAELLEEWMRSNPPATEAPAWKSVFEAGVRVANWCWAQALFLPSAALSDAAHLEVLRGLTGMGRFLKRHLEGHAWNNHLLLEAKALAMLGLLHPELPGAAGWTRVGLRILRRQLERQVLADGVHSERSSFYHKLIASELLEQIVVMRLAGGEASDLLGHLRLLAAFLAAMTRADGSIPMLGDASRHDEHIRYDPLAGAALLFDLHPSSPGEPGEGTRWLVAALGSTSGRGEMKARAPAGGATASRAFPAGGYWVMRAGGGDHALHLVFDCGPFSDPVVAGHGHADALSIDIAVGKHNFIIDPGMYSAHLGDTWRNFFRGTAAHNTVVIDGKDQTILKGVRRAYRPAPALCLEWLSTPDFDLVAGEHRGYQRLAKPIMHCRRILFRKPRFWLVIDRLEGAGSHAYDLLFHLPPGAAASVDAPSLGVTVAAGDAYGLAILPVGRNGLALDVIEGQTDPPQGWVALMSGVKEPAPVLRYHREGPAPVTFVTLLVPIVPGGPGKPRIEALEIAEEGRDAVAGRLRFDGAGGEELFLAWVGEAERSPRRRLVAGPLATDAALAALSLDARGRVEAALVVGGTCLEYNGSSLFQAPEAGEGSAFRFDGGGFVRAEV